MDDKTGRNKDGDRDPKTMKLILNLQMNSSGSSNDESGDESPSETQSKDILWFLPSFIKSVLSTTILLVVWICINFY